MLSLKVLQAEYGDCLILVYGQAAHPSYMLVDGGPPGTYENTLRSQLETIHAAGGKLDLVTLSHVDEDHVMGLLQLLAEIRTQRGQGQPETIRIEALWHNTFSNTLGPKLDKGFREAMQSRLVSRGLDAGIEMEPRSARENRSIAQGDDLTVLAEALNLPLNPQFIPQKLITVDNAPPSIKLGDLTLRIIGPNARNLARLRKSWLAWLNKRKKALAITDTQAADRAAQHLDSSTPNLSSIMFLAESEGKRILFTGDGRGDYLLNGLKEAGLLDANGGIHVDVLKLPHHGSIRNVPKGFFKSLLADWYVISANGQDGNPDLETLNRIAEAAKELGRQITIVATNETASTQAFLAAHDPSRQGRDPAQWGFRWIELPKDSPSLTLDVPGGTVAIEQPRVPAPQITITREGGVPVSKKALLVGINNFIRPDWTLRGCINDTAEMHSTLTTYYGFADADIKVLNDGDATNQGIRDGLDWLLSGYAGDDVRVFHFSSHGTQVEDDSNDEMDAQDEVIVPYDHSWTKPFRDDDLRVIFDKIPADVNFTFIADCCHSGSIQRALIDRGLDFKSRYLTPPPEIVQAIDRRKQLRDAKTDAAAAAKLQEMLQGIPQDQWAEKIPGFLASLRKRYKENRYGIVNYEKQILLAGCEDRQTSADAYIDGVYRGAFTWGLGKAIREANGDLTYKQLIQHASKNMTRYEQNPQLECPPKLRDLKLFSPLH